MSDRRPSRPSRSSGATDPPAPGVGPGTNVVVLRGVLSREPDLRALPSGDALVAYELTVRPAEPAGGARAESVPVCWFDPPRAATALDAGDDVVVVGRVRRRFFRAGGATASRTEVVATAVVPVRSAARVGRAVGAAVEVLTRASG